jgi:hypothetical protein
MLVPGKDELDDLARVRLGLPDHALGGQGSRDEVARPSACRDEEACGAEEADGGRDERSG